MGRGLNRSDRTRSAETTWVLIKISVAGVVRLVCELRLIEIAGWLLGTNGFFSGCGRSFRMANVCVGSWCGVQCGWKFARVLCGSFAPFRSTIAEPDLDLVVTERS